MLVGYALLLVTCFAGEYNCDSKPVSSAIYASRTECEWELNNQAFYYPKENLTCAEVRRPS